MLTPAESARPFLDKSVFVVFVVVFNLGCL